MKFICAGYPKTGSKSCSAALRQLGYTVCDYVETMEYIAPTWADYVAGHVQGVTVDIYFGTCFAFEMYKLSGQVETIKNT